MRYGIVPETGSLPPPAPERLIEESGAGALAAARLEELIAGLKPGDELLLPSLDVLAMTSAEIALVLQDLLEAGVVVKIAEGSPSAAVLRPGDPAASLVALLADHERRRPTALVEDSRPRSAGGSRRPLSRYQIEYARKLYAKGTPLRAIGLLFQVSPDVIWKVVGGAGPAV